MSPRISPGAFAPRARYFFAGVLPVILLYLLLATPSVAGVTLHLIPGDLIVDPGDSFLIELTVPTPADSFNGYDAVIGYDPSLLTFLQEANVADQEGPLMVDACPSLRFHRFILAPDSTSITINHVLLCAGVKVAGPGVLYRLRFRAKGTLALTRIRVLEGTQFYDEGLYANPLFSHDALIHIGQGTSASPPPWTHLRLRAAPNPFNPRTMLSFDLPTDGWADLRIYAADGRLVRVLVEEVRPRGFQTVAWDGTDGRGRAVASGFYTARLFHEGKAASTGLVLLK